MNKNNCTITQPPKSSTQPKPRSYKKLPDAYDPTRRLVAAIVLQAVTDHLYPCQDLHPIDRATAVTFLASDDASFFIEQFSLFSFDAARQRLPILNTPYYLLSEEASL